MPANLIRESGESIGTAFEKFSESAQRIGVYTALDYVDILDKLNVKWEIDKLVSLSDEAEKARDYLLKLPARMTRVAERMVVPAEEKLFSWVQPALIR
jgi:acyl-[acyl-carrier-protein] desaturase